MVFEGWFSETVPFCTLFASCGEYQGETCCYFSFIGAENFFIKLRYIIPKSFILLGGIASQSTGINIKNILVQCA